MNTQHKGLFKWAGKAIFVVALATIALYGAKISGFTPPAVDAAAQVDEWWPTDGTHISTSQSLKAMWANSNLAVSQYSIAWSVDGGQQNLMDEEWDAHPHKESNVDLSGWTWKGQGPYAITFTAHDSIGNLLGARTVNIYVDTPTAAIISAQQGTPIVPAPPIVQTLSVTAAVSAPVQNTTPVQSTVPQVVQTSPTLSLAAQQAPPPADTTSGAYSVDAWWPVDAAHIAGSVPFKAMVKNADISAYDMYWQVDGGQLNSMGTNYTDYPHKEIPVDVSGWNWHGAGPYTITFFANLQGGVVVQKSIQIYVSSTGAAQPLSTVQTSTNTLKPEAIAVAILSANGPNPFSEKTFWVDPYSDAKKTADAWRASRPADAAQMDKIASHMTTQWIGDWNPTDKVQSDVNGFETDMLASGAYPVYVAYNIPNRDCGGFSGGGAGTADNYRAWVNNFANGIGNRPAAVILEPDAMALTDCLSGGDLQTRYDLINYAVQTFKSKGSIAVYIDAGHPNWISASQMADRLHKAGIDQADGFALNVSNYETTADNISYGTAISQLTGGKHFVIDTSRNGLGPAPDHAWCNPPGRAMGAAPTGSTTGSSLVDAFLWIHGVGGSDGSCNGAPPAGQYWAENALGMAQRTAW